MATPESQASLDELPTASAVSALFQTSDVNVTDAMINTLLDKRVSPYVHFSGLDKVHKSILMQEIQDISTSLTVKELFKATERARYRWMNIGVFNDVAVGFEPLADGSDTDICVHCHVSEKKPTKQLGVFTTDSSVPEITASLNNIWNSRYSISGKYIPPAARSHAASISLTSNVPLFGRTAEYYAGVKRDQRPMNLAQEESIEEVRITHNGVEPDSTSQFNIGLQRRKTASRDYQELPKVFQKELGEDYKAYVSHQYHASSEEYHQHPLLYSLYPLPVRGMSLFTSVEAAVDWAVRSPMLRTDLQLTKHWLIHPLVTATWSTRLGMAGSPSGHIPVNDRLYLGWRHVRGYRCIGPSTSDGPHEGCRFAATGGNALWATSLSLNFPMPFLPTNGLVTTHAFVDAGNNAYFKSWHDVKSRAGDFFSKASCSVGVGFVVAQIPFFGVLPSGRFEFNFALPISVDDTTGGFSLRQTRLFDKWRFGLTWSSNVSD
eukprot:GILI01019601.1.p1 GENE.GILI01019601.1~~GILI01019601.1.p1  ORF type:complete len:491 (-),score=40.83 GILI01019601.1:43-1515(-)